MTMPVALEYQHRLPAHHCVPATELIVGAARLLITLSPRRLRRVLELARHRCRVRNGGVEGRPISELHPAGHSRPLLTITPAIFLFRQ